MTEHLPECPCLCTDEASCLCYTAECICERLRACEDRVTHEERARIVAGISAWCADDPVISRANPDDVWHYARGVRFTRLRIERGDFNE
jgi:hypothetical protein